MSTTRKGARSIQDIPTDILEELNRGTLETASLVESLAIDQRQLLGHVLSEHERAYYLPTLWGHLDRLSKPTYTTRLMVIGATLAELALEHQDDALARLLLHHPSDMVRSWGAYLLAQDTRLSLPERLEALRPLASDAHFGVREIAWMALRPHIEHDLEQSLALLTLWAEDQDAYIRRFASEATRPRGVWCRHLEPLKQSPELALPILERLKADPDRYVQNSVGNWLNDASKTRPEFVRLLTHRWLSESSSDASSRHTAYIVQRALRSLR